MTNKNEPIDELTTRRERLELVKSLGLEVFPSKTERTHEMAKVGEQADNLIKSGEKITIAGRVRSLRGHGGSTFAHLEDGSGLFQVYAKKDELGEKKYDDLIAILDVGDFLQAQGVIFKTKRGEATLLIKDWKLLGKILRPLPEKWHGLQDIEIRFRKRYLDLMSSTEVRNTFKIRSTIIKTVRNFLDSRGFLEVDTPILQPLPGGASARPFVTHHNALGTDLYLRIAPELYLKRLVVGGYERVYEIARCFRNEGMDWSHNPEFTQVEFYQAFADYNDLMDETEDLVIDIVHAVKGA
ncbi:MAG: amino acid--tRNA ligase-related protein, partial [Patescibacteria group bacterium]